MPVKKYRCNHCADSDQLIPGRHWACQQMHHGRLFSCPVQHHQLCMNFFQTHATTMYQVIAHAVAALINESLREPTCIVQMTVRPPNKDSQGSRSRSQSCFSNSADDACSPSGDGKCRSSMLRKESFSLSPASCSQRDIIQPHHSIANAMQMQRWDRIACFFQTRSRDIRKRTCYLRQPGIPKRPHTLACYSTGLKQSLT